MAPDDARISYAYAVILIKHHRHREAAPIGRFDRLPDGQILLKLRRPVERVLSAGLSAAGPGSAAHRQVQGCMNPPGRMV